MTMRKTVLKNLLEDMGNTLNLGFTIETRINTKDPKKWFGEPPYSKNKIALRTFEQMKYRSIIELPQFDPNFFSPNEVRCRFYGCKKTRRDPSGHSGDVSKKDLYLCPVHRERMTNHIGKQCAKQNVEVNFETFKAEDFDGYISLISVMEQAHLYYQRDDLNISKPLKSTLSEIFLNTRNFFFITNAVLNPCFENLESSLPAILTILTYLLNEIHNYEYVRNLLFLLRNVMKTTLFFFGVLYTWISLPLSNPFGYIGGGVGSAVGALVTGWAFGPMFGLIALGAGIGLSSGALIGTGFHRLKQEGEQLREYDEAFWEYLEFMGRAGEETGLSSSFENTLSEMDWVHVYSGNDPLYYFVGNSLGDLFFSVTPSIL